MATKNYRGGYKIIDLLGLELTTGGNISGIHSAIQKSNGKPLLLTGIVISGSKKNDVFVIPEVSSSSFVLKNVYGYDITIESDDDISSSEAEFGTPVEANPVLAGTESALTGLQVGDTKYKVNGGTKIYKHSIDFYVQTSPYPRTDKIEIYNTSSSPYTGNPSTTDIISYFGTSLFAKYAGKPVVEIAYIAEDEVSKATLYTSVAGTLTAVRSGSETANDVVTEL